MYLLSSDNYASDDQSDYSNDSRDMTIKFEGMGILLFAS